MNKKLILIALSAMMFCSLSYAQKVIKSGSAVIIDCSEMDPKFYTTTKKPRTTDATNTTDGANNATVISSKESNAKVYKKFEVHPTDNEIPYSETWRGAIDKCANLSANGTDWRLPTQRELMLMWILKEKLVANGITPFVPYSEYWCATTSLNSTAYYVHFLNGFTDTNNKIGGFKVRCIRDL